jgi:hypothetical protein
MAAPEVLNSLKTFAWSKNRTLSLQDPQKNTSEVKAWLEEAIESGFRSKGLTKSTPETADILIGYSAGSHKVYESKTFNEYGELGQGQIQELGGSGQNLERSRTLNTEYEQERLILDAKNRKTGELVYRGVSEAELLTKPSQIRSPSRINQAVRTALKDWPGR